MSGEAILSDENSGKKLRAIRALPRTPRGAHNAPRDPPAGAAPPQEPTLLSAFGLAPNEKSWARPCLFTRVPLSPSSIIWYQPMVVMLGGWGGNRGPDRKQWLPGFNV